MSTRTKVTKRETAVWITAAVFLLALVTALIRPLATNFRLVSLGLAMVAGTVYLLLELPEIFADHARRRRLEDRIRTRDPEELPQKPPETLG